MDARASDRTKVMLVWPVAGFLVVIAFGVGLISMAAFDSSRSASATTAGHIAGASEVVEVELGDLFIEPAELTAPAGVPLTFEVTNSGATEHNFAIEDGPSTEMIPPGGTATLQIASLEAGEYPFLCEVAGHAGGGMRGVLTVSGEGTSAGGLTGHGGHGMSGMSAEEMVKVDTR
jgi:uncharacterized cupredoxin-like copper-binding protein